MCSSQATSGGDAWVVKIGEWDVKSGFCSFVLSTFFFHTMVKYLLMILVGITAWSEGRGESRGSPRIILGPAPICDENIFLNALL